MLEYKLTNITKWPGVTKGKHKHGFIVAIGRKSLHVGQHMTVPQMTEGIETLQKRKYLKVEAIENRQVLVRQQIEETEAEHQKDLEDQKSKLLKEQKVKADEEKARQAKALDDAKNVSKTSQPASSLDKAAMKEAAKVESQTKATVSAGEGEDPTGDLEEPQFEGGKEPNFMVRAGQNKGGNKGKNS